MAPSAVIWRSAHAVCRRSLCSAASVPDSDIVIVGGGIVGCATARELLLRHPNLKVTLLEKENDLAVHQSSRNSGVIHAGIYYAPGSLKAKLCVRGLDLSYAYFEKRKIPYKKCGKLIVAVEQIELQRLQDLYERAVKNGCRDLEFVESDRIKEFEPHCRGLRALWSPHTGIVDWGVVTHEFAKEAKEHGAKIVTNALVNGIKMTGEAAVGNRENTYPIEVTMEGAEKPIRTKHVITCAGLQSDRVAVMTGCSPDPKILPFRGEYLLLKPEKRHLVSTNVYPVPDPNFPFLGVHFTPRMNGDVWLGPNAVLAYKREGYSYLEISPKDTLEALMYSGMRRLILKYAVFGTQEFFRSIFMRAQVKQLQRFVPELSVSDVTRGPAGVRAQALGADGSLVDDFVFDSPPDNTDILHVRNAPSPACTSSMAIAEMIAEKAKEKFGLS